MTSVVIEESDVMVCQQCGKPLTRRQTKWCSPNCYALHRYHNNPERRERVIKRAQGRLKDPEWRKHRNKQKRRLTRKHRLDALDRLASLGLGKDGEVRCAHCGYSIVEALDIAHCNNDGAEHRKEIVGTIYGWVQKATDKEILDKNIRIECRNCNIVNWRTGKYPSEDELTFEE